MFDMGFTEMMLIGIVALIVIGPERLPGVARTAGKYVGRLKRFMTSVKADVEQELRADELRQILSQQQKELDSLKDTISEAGHDIEKHSGLDDIKSDLSSVGTSESESEQDSGSTNQDTQAEELPEPTRSSTPDPEPAASKESASKVNS